MRRLARTKLLKGTASVIRLTRRAAIAQGFFRSVFSNGVSTMLGMREGLEFRFITGFSRAPLERMRRVALPAHPKGVTPAEIDDLVATMQRCGLTGRYPASAGLIHRTAQV